jgi:hypothetical protein
MIRLKNAREVDGIRRSGRLLARALAALAAETRTVDTRPRRLFTPSGRAEDGLLGYLISWPICISVNERLSDDPILRIRTRPGGLDSASTSTVASDDGDCRGRSPTGPPGVSR